MRIYFLAPLLALLTIGANHLNAQWDATKSATGWARVDVTGMCTFYDLSSQKLMVNWMKDAGESSRIDIKAAAILPDKWFIDKYDGAWIVSGDLLQHVDKTAKRGTSHKLPGEVGDVAWGAKGFFLSYKTAEPFIEKRDEKTGDVLWAYGSKSKKNEVRREVLHRLAVGDNGNVFVASGSSLFVMILDGANGKTLGQCVLTYKDQAPPELQLGNGDRGPVAWWLNKFVMFSAIPASQVPVVKMNGLLLARLDFATTAIEFLPTGLSEDHFFVGVDLESQAMFIAPNGGLVYVPIR